MRDARFFLLMTVVVCLVGCASLQTDFERPETRAFPDTSNTSLGQYVSFRAAAHPGLSGFHLLANRLDAFAARAVLADLAERSIDAQYYLYHHDLVGQLFAHQLVKAADRGVPVRLLVGDMDLSGRDLGAAAMDSHPNIEVRVFNPFSRKTGRLSQYVTRMGSVTRRMHNKSFTVDNQMSILGGRNIGNEYFDADPDLAFADLDVLAIGPAARNVYGVFDRRRVFIGSLNLAPRAVIHNTEIGVVMTSPQIANDIGSFLEHFIKQAPFRLELVKNANSSETILWHGLVDGEPKAFGVEPYTGYWERSGVRILRILPIESQL